MRFSLNHAICPMVPIPDFLRLAQAVGIDTVELRNGMPPGWQMPAAANALSYSPTQIAELSGEFGISILSMNALQRFDLWDDERANEAESLIAFCREAGIPNLVVAPSVSESGPAAASQLESALDALQPMLESTGVRALIEPLGFVRCSLRSKQVADAAITARGNPECFGIVHDSFHHAVAGEQYYSPRTAIVHLSGVPDVGIPTAEWGDNLRILVDETDVLGNLDQVKHLKRTYEGVWSFEPFSSRVGESPTLKDDLQRSIAYIAGNS